MKAARVLIALVVIAVIAFICWYVLVPPPQNSGLLTIYYAKLDGTTLGMWTISQRSMEPGETPAQYLQYRAMYAAIQEVAGPPSNVQAIRFPVGTRVTSVGVSGSLATVDLSSDVTHQSGTFGENGQFKALVYTLTALPPIRGVQVMVAGKRLETLPEGNLELDAPLHRSDW
ncbi:MAG: GerMN domain-containing protein [Candidatus Tyrphobacter sp.]